ncbi:hypothetical protein BG015_000912 [Linnemannia schmuckeri]|uniref:Uncharacterized protein n=1 Tax=Linnemannia schmuckeri TaxID=64567 RepID=A0A9P5S461_9FUNG|nr:hypothetical protein BG015_000912 [Linnemannia schmuckeri]
METSSVQQQEQLFQKFESYDFETDANFQAGLKSIIGNNQDKSAQEQKDAVEKAKYFYYSRFVQNFDYNQYRAWRQLKAATSTAQDGQQEGSLAPSSTTAAAIANETVAKESQSSSTTAADPTYPKSFQEICELIASGKPIPGIRQIPNNLAEGTPSEAKLAPKLKPWEKKKAANSEEPVVESTPSAEATA